MASTLKLEIVTPDAVAYSADVRSVTLPAITGQITVLPHHVRLLTRVVPGEIIVHHDGRNESVVVGGGLVEVTGARVAIVTDMAVPAERIDEAKVEEARQRAKDRLREKLSNEEVALTNAMLARALAQIRVKRRHHT